MEWGWVNFQTNWMVVAISLGLQNILFEYLGSVVHFISALESLSKITNEVRFDPHPPPAHDTLFISLYSCEVLSSMY